MKAKLPSRPGETNGCPSINIDITGALFILRIQYEFTQTQCQEGASDIISTFNEELRLQSDSRLKLISFQLTVKIYSRRTSNRDRPETPEPKHKDLDLVCSIIQFGF